MVQRLEQSAAEEKAIIVGVSTPISTLRQTKPKGGSFSNFMAGSIDPHTARKVSKDLNCPPGAGFKA